jgi:molybdopterin-guanine dinucleotide biosynthesis protein A
LRESIYILAGGQSKRMGSDKGLIVVNGISLVERLCHLIIEIGFEPVIITSNKAYDRFGFTRLEDLNPGKGPLAGIQSALNHCSKSGAFILNVDIPFFDKEALNGLILGVQQQEKIHFVSAPASQHYLIGFYPKNALSVIDEQLKSNDYSIRSLLNKVGFVELNVSSDAPYFNFNQPQDLSGTIHEVTYFGMLSEVRKRTSEFVFISNEEKKDLQKFVKKSFPIFEHYNFQIAVDRKIRNEFERDEKIKEIALLPAFAGG